MAIEVTRHHELLDLLLDMRFCVDAYQGALNTLHHSHWYQKPDLKRGRIKFKSMEMVVSDRLERHLAKSSVAQPTIK